MKKYIFALALVVLTSFLSTSIGYAGHHHDHGDAGWAAAGGLLGGMLLGAAITDSSRPAYYYPQPVYYQPAPVYVQPAPYAQPVYYTPTTYAYPTYSTTTTTYSSY
jgi:hypothetical protein